MEKNCSKCKAKIFWIRTPAGKWAPVDARPKKVWIEAPGYTGPDSEIGSTQPGDWILVSGYESHFATCPAAGEFRKKPLPATGVGDSVREQKGA